MPRPDNRHTPKLRHNRIAAVMLHIPRYWEHGQRLLASDADISVSALSRLMRGKVDQYQFWLVARIATTLEKELGRRIDPRDLVSEDGEYPTRFVCDLTACPGCLPKYAYDKRNSMVDAFKGVQRGCWTGDIHEPKGEKYLEIKEVK